MMCSCRPSVRARESGSCASARRKPPEPRGRLASKTLLRRRLADFRLDELPRGSNKAGNRGRVPHKRLTLTSRPAERDLFGSGSLR